MMAEFRTLKDFNWHHNRNEHYCPTCHFNENELRQEVIKWIKELQKEMKTIKHNPEAYHIFKENPFLFEGEVNHTIRWIKHFFNITEKDLEE